MNRKSEIIFKNQSESMEEISQDLLDLEDIKFKLDKKRKRPDYIERS